jgi:hypothetical protein
MEEINTVKQVEVILSKVLKDISTSNEPMQAGYLRALLDMALIIEESK